MPAAPDPITRTSVSARNGSWGMKISRSSTSVCRFKHDQCGSESYSFLRYKLQSPLLDSFSRECGSPLIVERFDTLSEIVGLSQPAIAMPFHLDRDRKC